MKRAQAVILLCCAGFCAFGQAYIPMPSDSATWRYRWYDFDYETHVLDELIYMNGQDTLAYGNTYHQLMSRTFMQLVPNGTQPPIVSVVANIADHYYGAIRESGKKVYSLALGGEDLLFDFNAGIGDSIPTYTGKVRVTGWDSLNIGGVYHKVYRTADPGFYVVEGAGSNRGLIPQINDGGADAQFMCFRYGAEAWSPDTTIPCTDVYQIGHLSTANPDPTGVLRVFPNPVTDWLSVQLPAGGENVLITIFDAAGRAVIVCKPGTAINRSIDCRKLAKGFYLLKLEQGNITTMLPLIK